MPNLSSQEITEFNAIKGELKALWESSNIKDIQRQIPKELDGRRTPLMEWLYEYFDGETQVKLLQIKELFTPFFENLYSSKNSDATKTKKITVYRKKIAEFIGEDYTKNSYNLLPYLLFQSDLKITTDVKLKDMRRVKESNRGDNRIPVPKSILDELIQKAVDDLKKPVGTSSDYMSKSLALELLTGRRQYSEILNPDCFIELDSDGYFKVIGLAKGSQEKKETCFKLPFLGLGVDDNIVKLIQDNLKLVREFVAEKQGKKTSLVTLLNPLFMQAMVEYDAIFKPVRLNSSNMPFLTGKTHFLRKLYAFCCWVILDNQRSNESQYFAEILVHGDVKGEDFLTDDITAKSYSIFYLDK
jgi:Telomere resolvase